MQTYSLEDIPLMDFHHLGLDKFLDTYGLNHTIDFIIEPNSTIFIEGSKDKLVTDNNPKSVIDGIYVPKNKIYGGPGFKRNFKIHKNWTFMEYWNPEFDPNNKK